MMPLISAERAWAVTVILDQNIHSEDWIQLSAFYSYRLATPGGSPKSGDSHAFYGIKREELDATASIDMMLVTLTGTGRLHLWNWPSH